MKTAFRALTMMSAMSIVLLVGSCSKDNDPSAPDLIVGNWQIASVKVTMKVGSQSMVEYLISLGMTAAEAQASADQLEGGYEIVDGNLDLKAGGTYSSTSGGSAGGGTWELSSDRKTLTLDKGTPGASDFTVTTLTATNLNLTGDHTDAEGSAPLSIHMEIALTR